jgi:hypothetical protein
VNEKVRSAVYIEDGSIIKSIKKLFPNLIYENYDGGVIVSKQKYTNIRKLSANNFGKILGYPCYADFENLNRDIPYYGISIRINYNNNKSIQLFANVCKDKINLNKFKLIAKKAEKAIQKKEYKEIIKPTIINSIYVDTEIEIPTKYLIKKLTNNKKLSKIEKSKISEKLYNIGTSKIADYDFQYNNQIHRGILIELLLRMEYLSLKFSSNEREEYGKTNFR